LLRTLQAPPPTGSLQEWALIFYLDRLDDIEHMKFRALATLQLDKDAGGKAFEEYMRCAFPSLARKKEEEKKNIQKVLKDWTKMGPLKVIKQEELTIRSRMRARASKVDNALVDRVIKKGSPR
jgi:transcription termination factor NusB